MRGLLAKFFADRGTHLAAMVAYFALLSFVPLTFLALSLLGLAGQPTESSYLVTELKRIFPDTSVQRIVDAVDAVRQHAVTLGIAGAVILGWTSISLFSALESAFNIVYQRPNRSFLHGKALALLVLVGSLVTLFAGLLAGSLGYRVLERVAPGVLSEPHVAYALSVLASLAATFIFLVSVYYLLTNERVTLQEVLPGAAAATVMLEATFQALPIYLRLSKDSIALQAFGGPALLLVWLYVMANVIVFGAEINWWRAGRGRQLELEAAEPAGLA
jgi:membrane protein